MRKSDLDENLIFRIANGDSGAFRELYEGTSGAVYGFALSILKNRADAEDVMQETYIKTFRAAPAYKASGKPLSWILTIVRNLCYNRIRAGNICADLSEYESQAYADDRIDLALDRQLLTAALSKLDFEDRQIVILHAVTGLKHKEIAGILEVPLGTVLSKYKRSLVKLRKEIEGSGKEKKEKEGGAE